MGNLGKSVRRGVAAMMLALSICCAPLRAEAGTPRKIELAADWKLASTIEAPSAGAEISVAGYSDTAWHPIHRMPATVLEILQEDGVYPDLYVGKNLLEKVPQDLYLKDWWYRTSFVAPVGFSTYTLKFPGINYRAEIWLNGQRIVDSSQIVGMYAAHQLDATPWIKPGQPNVLAVKVTPERLIQDVNGVELADSWFDWVNWKYLGYKGEKKKPGWGISFVPDRNAGIWKPVYLQVTGSVSIDKPLVNTQLLLKESTARLTVYATLRNHYTRQTTGTLRGTISRPGKPTIKLEQPVDLAPGEEREISFMPEKFPGLVVTHPDLWWPYTMGDPALYNLHLEFIEDGRLSDRNDSRFGIRSITQHRDADDQFPEVGKGGNFYLQVNGRDFRARGADYT